MIRLMYFRDSHFHRVFIFTQFTIIVVQTALYVLVIDSRNHLADQ